MLLRQLERSGGGWLLKQLRQEPGHFPRLRLYNAYKVYKVYKGSPWQGSLSLML